MVQIKNLKIKNFKSVKNLELDCSRVNVFIGEPNTGKSNILEALGLFNIYNSQGNLKDFMRMKDMTNLFYETQISDEIYIDSGIVKLKIFFKDEIYYLFTYINEDNAAGDAFVEINYNFDGTYSIKQLNRSFTSPFKYYKYELLSKYDGTKASNLNPPRGNNLYNILNTNDKAYDFVNNLVNEFGFDLTLRQKERDIELYKKSGKRSITIPFNNLADTYLRMTFFTLAIMTNQDSILIFDEPDVFTFPYYSKNLAEKIGRDESNQYFLVTHNPYFLASLIEKTMLDDLKIFITYFEDNQTKVKGFRADEIREIIDIDSSIFFNLKNLINIEE